MSELPSPARHAARCGVCQSPEKASIEEDYVAHVPVDTIAERYDVNRDAIYRHAKACNLVERRNANLLGIIDYLIDKGLKDVEVTPALLASCLTTAAKLRGAFVADRPQSAALETATDQELQWYVTHGRMPTPQELQETEQ